MAQVPSSLQTNGMSLLPPTKTISSPIFASNFPCLDIIFFTSSLFVPEISIKTNFSSPTLADLIFPIPRLISYISEFTALSSGDVIVTGTPGGVGDKRNPPVYMVPGDVVEVDIGLLGVLKNPIVAAPKL